MLITFSGMVGSGKSTNAKNVVRLLRGLGYSPYLIRFRQIGWRHLLRSPALTPGHAVQTRLRPEEGRSRFPPEEERHLQPQKRLSFLRFLGYLVYILCFRLVMLRHHRQHLVVLDRYFYDNFAHFRIVRSLDRVYLRLLIAAVPKPDVAFFLVLSPESAHRRRPAYSYEALRLMAANYRYLRNFIEYATVVITDNLQVGDQQQHSQLQSEDWSVRLGEVAKRYPRIPRQEDAEHGPVWATSTAHATHVALYAVLSRPEDSQHDDSESAL